MAEIAAVFLGEDRRRDKKTVRRWESAVRRLERAEGASTPEMPQGSAVQVAAYARQRFASYMKGEGEAIRHMFALAEMQAEFEGLKGTTREARVRGLLTASPTFWSVAATARALAANQDQALRSATGRLPVVSTGDPEVNREKAAEYTARAEQLRLLEHLNLHSAAIRGLPGDLFRRVELLRLLDARGHEQRSERYAIQSPDRWMIRRAEAARRESSRKIPRLRPGS